MRPEICADVEDYAKPSAGDWEYFRQWAAQEGWRVPARELALYGGALADSAFALRGDDKVPLGFITVCRHQCCGWIGNLLVDRGQRGHGIGRRLFDHAVGLLSARGVPTIWLTASRAGLPLYAASGFREAGRVERWICEGTRVKGQGDTAGNGGDLHALARADAAAWGSSRAELLSLLGRGARIFTSSDTVAMLQGDDALQVLGPWLTADLCPRANRTVLGQVLDSWAGQGELAVDVMGGTPVRLLLHAAGFRQAGETVLMVRGEPGKVKFGAIVALASLGSMG